MADAGNNAAVPVGTTLDAAGATRFGDIVTTTDTGAGTAPIVDMGAYEATGSLTASAGNGYVVLQGGSLTLSGHGASIVAGPLSFAWEWTGDGQFDDATGASPVFTTAGFPVGIPISISVRVTDAASQTATATTTLRIAPLVAYVDARATGANNGTTWNDAFTSLQTALDQSLPGQIIRVGTGTYLPTTVGTNRTISFNIHNDVSMFGGYAGFGAADPDARDPVIYPSVLSGNINGDSNDANNSIHVVTAYDIDSATAFDGFSVTGGFGGADYLGTGSGGGLHIENGAPKINNCTFYNNNALQGGGIYTQVSSASITHCTFASNASGTGSQSGGGAVFTEGLIGLDTGVPAVPAPSISDCTFTSNTAVNQGGAVDNDFCSTALANCTFTGNTASSGGGLYFAQDEAVRSITNCTFMNNSATTAGGALYGANSTKIIDFPVTTSTFSGNSAPRGGAMYLSSVGPEMTDCAFTSNSATSTTGGTIDAEVAPVTMTRCTFTGNSALTLGGALYNSSSLAPIDSSTFAGNTAASGGAIYTLASLKLSNSTFLRNTATSNGGALDAASSSPTITNCTLTGNSASNGGGAYMSATSSISNQTTFTNCLFSGNVAKASGGALYYTTSGFSSGTRAVYDCTLASNSAATSGGAIFAQTNLPTLYNSIVWGNTAPSSSQISSATALTNCDVQGGFAGTAIINLDPVFVRNPAAGADSVFGTADDDYGDLRLRLTSPCIDVGSNTNVPASATTDLAGNPRIVNVPNVHDPNAIVDIGAYEYAMPLAGVKSELLVSATKPALKLTFNGDVSPATVAAGDLTMQNLTTGQTINTPRHALSLTIPQPARRPGRSTSRWLMGIITQHFRRIVSPIPAEIFWRLCIPQIFSSWQETPTKTGRSIQPTSWSWRRTLVSRRWGSARATSISTAKLTPWISTSWRRSSATNLPRRHRRRS